MTMRRGRGHSWDYQIGRWNEVKRHRDGAWPFHVPMSKRRSGREAPKFSGLPIGTTLRWGIFADQFMRKTGKDTYKGKMQGLKFIKGIKFPKKKWKNFKWKKYLKRRTRNG